MQVIDLFAGCGGMSLGFQQAGFEVVAAFDNWDCAVETYSANLGHPATLLDLGDNDAVNTALDVYRNGASFPIIVGAPPCQDFSSAGTRTEGTRADLTEAFAATVARFGPPIFVMENVPLVAKSAVFARATHTLSQAGYTIDTIVLDASLYGVPQKRKRLFTIGSRDPHVAARVVDSLMARRGTTPMTVRDWFGDQLGVDTYYHHPRSYARRAIFSIDEPSPTIRGINRPIPPSYVAHPGDAGPAETSRSLTTAERAQIQTFPTDYKWVGSRTKVEQMIGNAVPVKLAQAVAESLKAAMVNVPRVA